MKKIYIWGFIIILLMGFIIMSLIITVIINPVLLGISKMAENFIKFIKNFLK